MSNTGAVSDTDLPMTLNTSEVAVCRSSASCVSLNRRTFSMAITAWLAKVDKSSISLPTNSPTSGRITVMAPTVRPSRNIGTASTLR